MTEPENILDSVQGTLALRYCYETWNPLFSLLRT